MYMYIYVLTVYEYFQVWAAISGCYTGACQAFKAQWRETESCHFHIPLGTGAILKTLLHVFDITHVWRVYEASIFDSTFVAVSSLTSTESQGNRPIVSLRRKVHHCI